MAQIFYWRVWCTTEASWQYTESTTTPTECPNDPGHSIDTSKTAIVFGRGGTELRWEGTWTTGNYTIDAVVEYTGASYVCILDTVSNENPSNATYWELLAEKGDTGAAGATGDTGAQGIQGPAGADGATGADGADGADGAAGTTLHSGLTDVTAAQHHDNSNDPTSDQSDALDGASLPSGTNVFVTMDVLNSGREGFDVIRQAYSGNSKAFIEISSSTYEVIGKFTWKGTGITGAPTIMRVVSRYTSASGNNFFRLFDYTNGAVLAEITKVVSSTLTTVESTTTFTNLPAGEAVIEVHAREDSNGKLEMNAMELEF